MARLVAFTAQWTGLKKVTSAIVAVVLVGCGLAAGLAVTGGGREAPAAEAPAVAPMSTATPTPTPTPTPTSSPTPAPVNPLTGVGPPVRGPVIAVKIDDVADALPQAGIDQADIVYVEQVEGGLTRLLAVFDTHKPAIVGPVRSTRADNPELLAQYGPIVFAASGGGGDSLPLLDQSPLKSVINDRDGPGFFRDYSRVAPHNLMINLQQVAAAVHGASAKSIGLTWAPRPEASARAKPATSLSALVGGTPVSFQWDAASKRYVRYIDGVAQQSDDGKPVATPNVIVQFCDGHVNPADIDPAGNPGWFTSTVGHGKASVFRDGKRIDGTWSRPNAKAGTTFRDAAGQIIPLAPGGAWVVLSMNGAALTSQ
ncbi:MAG: DUF3048 domain-containing protein [Actinomycetia bacterium]|nr:DUF3048 domain-containing protein [Actinomycetes bacterium]